MTAPGHHYLTKLLKYNDIKRIKQKVGHFYKKVGHFCSFFVPKKGATGTLFYH